MDKKLQNLDPKLRQAYERVMGASVPKPPESQKVPDRQSKPSPASPALGSDIIIKTKKSGASQLFAVTLLVLFFIAYAFFWIVFFKVKLPFRLPFNP